MCWRKCNRVLHTKGGPECVDRDCVDVEERGFRNRNITAKYAQCATETTSLLRQTHTCKWRKDKRLHVVGEGLSRARLRGEARQVRKKRGKGTPRPT